MTPSEQPRDYLTPDEVAQLDPFGVRKRKLEDEAASLEQQAPVPARRAESSERPDLIEVAGIMGENLYGPEEIKKAFGVELEDHEIPPLPFSHQELEHFKKEYFLVLRTNRFGDGKPITIQELKKRYEVDPNNSSVRIFRGQDWYDKPENSDPFYTDQIPKVQWALVKKEILNNSNRKNYQAQEQLLEQYRQQEQTYLEPNHQIERMEAVDIAFDLTLAYLSRGQKFLPHRWNWSKTKLTKGTYAGRFARLGRFDSEGFNIHANFPDISFDVNLGVCPSVVSVEI